MTIRHIARILPMVLAATLLTAVSHPTAWAGEPSVPLPTTKSTPVTPQNMGTRPPDQASSSELHGNQPAGGGAKEGGGTNKATPLSQSATWNVSAQTGDFSWSYPLRVPPSPGGLDPKLALNYASSSVDGRTSATNNQASWVGDGWDLSVGFIERSYIPCADDVKPVQVGDLCWRSDNATASYGGGGGQLIKDDNNQSLWRNKNDDGSRIERLPDGSGGEYWRITTVDGTRYLFGSRSEAKSTWSVPVFGNDVGEPCHAATFADSHCVQPWRWNLDKVIDRHGNVIEYNYDTESNSYGMNLKDAAVSYTRSGTLREALYGLRDGSDQQATGRVDFATADRCVPGSDCTPDKKDNWPDTSWDDKCDTATCKDKYSPTFWSSKRLSKVTTQVWNGSGFADVESWTLDQTFPVNGDGEKPALWLKSVTDSGLAGGTIVLPAVKFEGTKFPNRVDTVDGLGPLLRYRITGVVSESGGVTTVAYASPDCTSRPANAETNALRCFPMTWAKKDFSERTDYFNKYVVAQVTQSDMIAANTEDVTSYQYLDGAAWAYDTSEFTKEKYRNWNDFRGFGHVKVIKGKTDDLAGPQSMTEEWFYRGMDGDHLSNGTRSITVTDSEGGGRKDDNWLQGFEYESQVHLATSAQIVSKSIITPAVQGPTATRGSLKAYLVETGTTVNYAALSAGGWRTTRTEQSYDDLGQLLSTNDLGDVSTAADDRCTRTTYARNTDRWLISYPSQTETVSVACSATPKYPDNAMSGTRYSYDGKAFGAAPDNGDVTRSEVLDSYPASGAQYITASTAGFDALGRVTTAANALGKTTTTAYTPATGGPVTQTAVTNPLGQTTTTTVDPAYGQPTTVVDANGRLTETAYDPLGRKAQVWLANRPRGSNADGNVKFAYNVRNDGATVVTTTALGPNGHYTSGNDIYDGLMRLRQTQQPASGGGRLIVDTKYDSQGRQYKVTKPYFNDAPVDDQLWIAADVDVPSQTVSQFDGAGRKTAEITMGAADELWRTTTAYDGDRTVVTPPVGAPTTMAIADARGRTVELRQFHGREASGDYDSTTYTYTPAGKLTSTTDPAGNTWHRSYDLRGNEVRDDDVDKGTSTMTYDAAGQLVTSTDARGQTLTNAYDDLGRKTATRIGSAVQSQWTYDTALSGKGQLASSTRFVDGKAYTSTIGSYDVFYHPLSDTVTIPDTEFVGGTYKSSVKYKVDGSPYSTGYAAVGDLPAETVLYTYNDLGQLLTSNGGFDGNTYDYVTDMQYTRYGEVSRVQLGDTGKRAWLSTYYDDHTRRVDRTIVDAEVTAPMQADTNYSYNPAGSVTSIVDKPQGGPIDNQCFTMDYLQRITQAWTPAGDCTAPPAVATLSGPAPYWQSFSYDKVGNRLTETQHAAAGDTVTTGSFPASGHKLNGVSTTGPAGSSASQFIYDTSGNTITRKLPGNTQQLDWDAEGHLAKVTDNSGVTDFVYDADGNRLIRHDATGTTLFLDGQELHYNQGTKKLEGTRYYQNGGSTVAMRDATGLTWLASDHQGTSQIAINSDTLKVTQRRQLPFGGPRGQAVDFPGSKGFVGGNLDKSIGLTRLGAREYDPALGRFMSVDPIADPNDSQQLHGYTYANNNPITKSDPTGLCFIVCLAKVWDGVKSVAKSVGGWVASTATSFTGWVDRNRNWIGAVAGIVGAIATPVGIIGAIALGVSTAMTARDMYVAAKSGDTGTFVMDIFSFGIGAAGYGLGRLASQAGRIAEADAKAMGATMEQQAAANKVASAPLGDPASAINTGGAILGGVQPVATALAAAGQPSPPAPVRYGCNPPGFYGPYACPQPAPPVWTNPWPQMGPYTEQEVAAQKAAAGDASRAFGIKPAPKKGAPSWLFPVKPNPQPGISPVHTNDGQVYHPDWGGGMPYE
ncbi:MAG TPA: RHS repeat-associated core domain-containing protein [Kutzneria sp.]|nr:RHS repeat-associated core domain-containing protein [Kutzneria sp.]